MKDYYKSLVLLCILLLVFEGVVFCFGVNKPYWGDEAHFVDTVHRFGTDMGLQTIKHYNEMSTPLPFILYALWGRIFGFDVQILRIFSVIIALATYLLLHHLVFSVFHDTKIALLTTAFVVFNPYMIGLSIFVFTDMFAILFIILGCISIREHYPVLLGISLACGLLCRQYVIFFVCAVGLYFLSVCWKNRKQLFSKNLAMLFFSVISILPMVLLSVLWRGLSPDNELRHIFLSHGYRFHLSFLTLYVCQLFIYLVPIVALSWRTLYRSKRTLLVSLVVSFLYWLFPVRCHIDADIDTVGFFHKFVKFIFKSQYVEDFIFYVAFVLGLPILFFVLKDIYSKWKQKNVDFTFFLDISIIVFFMVMPFSYLCWEKYFLPLLPLVAIRILSARYSCQERVVHK